MRVVVRERRQITLPREVCESLGIQIGDNIEIVVEEGAALLRPQRTAVLNALDEFRRAIAESGVTEDELLESGREVRRALFRETYPDLARQYGI